MVEILNDIQNKEDRENKFLSDRIIQKALDSGEIDSVSTDEIIELFQVAFSENKGKPARIRAEALMFTLRDYIANKEKKQTGGEVDGLQKLQNETLSETVKNQVVQTGKEDNRSIYKEEQDFLQKTINEKIADANVSEQLREKAKEILLKETQHVVGTGVNNRVVEKTVIKELEVFKKEHEPKKEQQREIKIEEKKELAVTKDFGVVKPAPATNLPAERKGSGEEEDKKETDIALKIEKQKIVQDSVDTTQAQNIENSIKKESKPTKNKKLSLTEAVLQKAREDDINSPLKPNTLHRPSSPISFGTSSRKNLEPEDVVLPPDSAQTTDNVADKESLGQTKNQPKSQTIKNSISQQDEEVKQEGEKKPEIIEKEVPSLSQLPDQSSHDISSASNTKMVFDRELELEGSRVEAKHSVHKQNQELFDKYINEQVDIAIEVITQNNDRSKAMLDDIKKNLAKQAIKISENDKISISERIQQLDNYFLKQKKEYATKQAGESFNPQGIINDIIRRSEEEIDTGNQEADKRFRETLQNTLSFKARHLMGSGQDPDSINIALSEEYAKYKFFYTKNI